MKRILQINIIIAFLGLISIPAFGQAGTINYSQYCYNTSFHSEWVIDVKELKAVRFTYTTDVVYGPPMISIYELGTDGVTYNYITSISGYTSGTICTSSKTGKAKVVFNAWAIGNATFNIQYSADNPMITNSDLTVGGNGTINGKLGVGKINPQFKLDVNGEIALGNGSVNANTTKMYLRNPVGKTWAISSGTNNVAEASFSIYNWTDQGAQANPLPYFNITHEGYVGIGTYNATAKLDVQKIATENGNDIIANFQRCTNNNGGSGIIRIGSQTTADLEINSGNSTTGQRFGTYADFNIVNNTPGGTYGGVNFVTNSATRMTVKANGNVGIGTTDPYGLLQIGNSFSDVIGSPKVRISTQTGGPGTVVNALHIDTHNDGNYDQGVAIAIGLENTTYGAYTSRIVHYGYVDQKVGSKLQIQTHSNTKDIWNSGILIDDIGRVGIGTTTPDVALTVKGSIHANEVIIDVLAPIVPDYVFHPSYTLMPLHEVEQYVKTNSHLPEIPSAAEVSKNGMSIGEMQNKLLQKIEELTLYVIEQQKEINLLKQGQK